MIQPPHEALTMVLIRDARANDAFALGRLAERDSKELPDEQLLIAEVDGELRAALPLRNGEALADPFHPTAELVRLLELRRAQLDAAREAIRDGQCRPVSRRRRALRPLLALTGSRQGRR